MRASSAEYDAFDHLRSIHYCFHQYEYGRGWCTHAGVQDSRLQLGANWRADWRKPVVFDECRYEGNIASRWGNHLRRRHDAPLLAWPPRRAATAATRETYLDRATTFSGGPTAACSTAPAPPKSPSSANCLKRPSPSVPAPSASPTSATTPMAARRPNGSVVFYYFDEQQPGEGTFPLPEGNTYTAEYIDTVDPGPHAASRRVLRQGRSQTPRHPLGLSLVPPERPRLSLNFSRWLNATPIHPSNPHGRNHRQDAMR